MSSPDAHVADPTIQTRTTIPSGVAQINGVFAVLEGLRQGQDVLMGGYGYLEWSAAGNCWHEGLDLNSMGGGDADLGAAVVAPLAGVVTFVGWWDGHTQGFGNHLAMWIDDPKASQSCFMHVAHLDSMVVWEGQRVIAGEIVGACGKSGRQPYAHVHTSLWHEVPPGGWSFWQTGYSKAWVAERTLDPQAWWWASVAKAGTQVPPEVVMAMTDWELINYVLQPLYEWAGLADQFNPESGICKAWVAATRAGHYPGRPRTGERTYGEPAAGVWQECEQELLIWKHDGTASWEG